MPNFRDDEQILNYHDAVVYGSDLRLVQSTTAWLNDACIHFYFTYLQQQEFPQHGFVDPSVINFFMHQCTDNDDLQEFRQSFSLPMEKLFIPVNDTMKLGCDSWMMPSGGNHWSLLCVGAKEAWHLDSMPSSGNIAAARDIVSKLASVFPTRLPSKLMEAKTPPQTNGYDCGVHTLTNAMLLASTDPNDTLSSCESMLKEHAKSNPNFCQEMRARIANEMIQKAASMK